MKTMKTLLSCIAALGITACGEMKEPRREEASASARLASPGADKAVVRIVMGSENFAKHAPECPAVWRIGISSQSEGSKLGIWDLFRAEAVRSGTPHVAERSWDFVAFAPSSTTLFARTSPDRDTFEITVRKDTPLLIKVSAEFSDGEINDELTFDVVKGGALRKNYGPAGCALVTAGVTQW